MLTHFSRQWQVMGLLGLSFVASSLARPGLAAQTQVFPVAPQLGDTTALQIQVDNPQSPLLVKIGNKTYPVFSLGGKRYRALIPSTPLEKPGVRTVQVTADGKTKPSRLPLLIASSAFSASICHRGNRESKPPLTN
jgi:hypothetical protein